MRTFSEQAKANAVRRAQLAAIAGRKREKPCLIQYAKGPFAQQPLAAGPLSALNKVAVAPRTGAWIETKHFICEIEVFLVAPRTGAWIETPAP